MDIPGDTDQLLPSINAGHNDNFFLVWEDPRKKNCDIYAQCFAGDGNKIGANFRVNDDWGSSTQWDPSISVSYNGRFVTVWVDSSNDHYCDIYAQIFNSDGAPSGDNFRVNDERVWLPQNQPSVDMSHSGHFVVTWVHESEGRQNDIYAQCYSIDGSASGNNFKVNDDQGVKSQIQPSISLDENNNFVICWSDNRNGVSDIYAQRYSADGTTLGTNFKVNDDAGNIQRWPSISSGSKAASNEL